MESPEYSPVAHHTDASTRPSLGFPLGTALLLIVIFSLSGIFSCCYHWEKFRSLRQSFSDNNLNVDLEANHSSPIKPLPNPLVEKQGEMKSMTVIMPGNKVATFIAMPCPRQPPHLLMSAPPPPPPLPNHPPKPPRLPPPLY